MPLLTYDPVAQALWASLLEAHRQVPKQSRTMKLAYRDGLLEAWCIVTGENVEFAFKRLNTELGR